MEWASVPLLRPALPELLHQGGRPIIANDILPYPNPDTIPARPGTLEQHDGCGVVEQALALHHDLQLLRRAGCVRAPSKVSQASTALVTTFRA
jgi:hypothetical protein